MDLKKLFKLGAVGVMIFVGVARLAAEEKTEWIVAQDFIIDEGRRAEQYFLDSDPQGFGYRIFELGNYHSSDILKRYLQVGGQLVYEDEGLTRDKFYNSRVIAVITKDKRRFEITDLFPNLAETYTRAFSQNAKKRQTQR
jgi:hypothetical protein